MCMRETTLHGTIVVCSDAPTASPKPTQSQRPLKANALPEGILRQLNNFVSCASLQKRSPAGYHHALGRVASPIPDLAAATVTRRTFRPGSLGRFPLLDSAPPLAKISAVLLVQIDCGICEANELCAGLQDDQHPDLMTHALGNTVRNTRNP